MPHVRCHMSCVRCQVSGVRCHLSHVTNANTHSHGPSPCNLPQYAQQDAAADLEKAAINSGLTFCIEQFCNIYAHQLFLEQMGVFLLQCMRMASFSEAGHNLTWPRLILDSKAFGLATEDRPRTAGPAVPQFMSACLVDPSTMSHKDTQILTSETNLILIIFVKD